MASSRLEEGVQAFLQSPLGAPVLDFLNAAENGLDRLQLAERLKRIVSIEKLPEPLMAILFTVALRISGCTGRMEAESSTR